MVVLHLWKPYWCLLRPKKYMRKATTNSEYLSIRKKYIGKMYALLHLLCRHKAQHPFKSVKDIYYFLFNKNAKSSKYVYKNYNLLRIDHSNFELQQIFDFRQYDVNLESEKPVIVDLGSNIGISIVFFKNKFPYAKIFGFEPNINLKQIVLENMFHNISDLKNIHIQFTAVLAHKTKQSVLYIPNGKHSQARVKTDKYRSIDSKNEILYVKSISFSEVVSRFEKIDLLKMDIEGEEFNVFPNIIKHNNKIRFLIVEVHECTNSQMFSIIKKMEKYYSIVVTPAFTNNVTASGLIDEFIDRKKQTYLLYAKHL